MSAQSTKIKERRDEVGEWPFIRWIEKRKRWQVDARTDSNKGRSCHKTKGEAEGVASAARTRRLNEGLSAFDDRELAQHGWTVQQAIRFAVEHLRTQAHSVTIEHAVDALIAQKKASGKSDRYQRDLRNRLSRLVSAMPGKKIGTITTGDLDKFLNELNLAPGTINTFRRDIRTLWSFSEKRGWTSAKTAKNTDRATMVDGSPEIFTPVEAASLLAASKDDVLAYHAIGLFAGLRVAEIHSLDWSDVDLEGGFINVSAAKAKTRRRRLVPILDALRAWITPLTKTSGAVILPDFRKRQEAARNLAGFKPETEDQKNEKIKLREWPQNALRHSFVSYRLASTNDAAKTALESGHDQAVLFAHYRELVKPKDAARYFNIRPAVTETAPSVSPGEARDAAIRRLVEGRVARRKPKPRLMPKPKPRLVPKPKPRLMPKPCTMNFPKENASRS